VIKQPSVKAATTFVKLENSVKSTTKSSASKRRVEFVLVPSEKVQAAIAEPKAQILQQSSSVVWNKNDDDETEIERPAGRLWSQQPDWDDSHYNSDNDDIVSLDGATTFRQEMSDALRYRHEQKLRAELAEDERCMKVMEANAMQFTDKGAYQTNERIQRRECLVRLRAGKCASAIVLCLACVHALQKRLLNSIVTFIFSNSCVRAQQSTHTLTFPWTLVSLSTL
jgi:hypothetical protein